MSWFSSPDGKRTPGQWARLAVAALVVLNVVWMLGRLAWEMAAPHG